MLTLQIEENKCIKIEFYDKNNNLLEQFYSTIKKNGACKFTNMNKYFKKYDQNSEVLSDSIQLNINRDDLSIRLADPPHPVWIFKKDYHYWIENEENLEDKKIENIWIESLGITFSLNKTGIFWFHPNSFFIKCKMIDLRKINKESTTNLILEYL